VCACVQSCTCIHTDDWFCDRSWSSDCIYKFVAFSFPDLTKENWKNDNTNLKRFEEIELPAKLIDDFLWLFISNVNQEWVALFALLTCMSTCKKTRTSAWHIYTNKCLNLWVIIAPWIMCWDFQKIRLSGGLINILKITRAGLQLTLSEGRNQAHTQCSAAFGTWTLSARSGVHSALSAQ